MKTVRIRFEKTGDAKFVSHLDLNRTMIFALRRARLPVWYTEGFNPHPRIVFSPALQVGVESVCELMDIRLTDDGYDVGQIPAVLGDRLPPAFRILEAYDPQTKLTEIEFARYRVDADAAAVACLAEFFARPSIPAQKPLSAKEAKKAGPGFKTVELKDRLLDPLWDDGGFCVTLPCGSGGGVAPKLLFSALSDFSGAPFVPERVLRTELLTADLRPFR